MYGSNQGWERVPSLSHANIHSRQAAKSAEARRPCIDSRKLAMWFQLGTLGDARMVGSSTTPPRSWPSDASPSNRYPFGGPSVSGVNTTGPVSTVRRNCRPWRDCRARSPRQSPRQVRTARFRIRGSTGIGSTTRSHSALRTSSSAWRCFKRSHPLDQADRPVRGEDDATLVTLLDVPRITQAIA